MNTKKKFQLEIGDNWWSRVLKIFLWISVIITFLLTDGVMKTLAGECKRDSGICFIDYIWKGLTNSFYMFISLLILWAILQWIISGKSIKSSIVGFLTRLR